MQTGDLVGLVKEEKRINMVGRKKGVARKRYVTEFCKPNSYTLVRRIG